MTQPAGSQLPTSVLYYGSTHPLPIATPLRAGPLSLLFEAGDLRYVRLGSREIIRRVYVAVRDHNWDTIPGQMQDLNIEARDEAFSISFTMIHQQGGVHFTWEGEIRGRPSGEITYAMNGQALSVFRRNRIGICVLHPAACAGAPVRVEHVLPDTDGASDTVRPGIEESCFPTEISPHQPFMDIRAITHIVEEHEGEKVEAEVRFAGDVFEMEDQRNWTDASFKTYSTPLSLPFPVQSESGELVQQSVEVRVLGPVHQLAKLAAEARAAVDAADHPVQLTIGADALGTLPRLGLGLPAHREALSMSEINRLRALAPAHLRVDLHPQSRAFVALLRDAWREAAFLGAKLEVALFLTDDAAAELAHVARATGEFNPDISHWLIFHKHEPSTTAQWMLLARDVLGSVTPEARFIAGTNAYFTELNRGRPPVTEADGVAYSINPQVHAFDILSLVETLEAQGVTVASTRSFAGNLPIYISPVTLRPRFNPNATGPEPEPAPGELPAAVDPRQMSLFGAGWTLGSVKYLAQAGAAGVTYYETTGVLGVIERAAGSPYPELFRSLPGGVFPLYHVLADIGEMADAQLLPVATAAPLFADGLALRTPDGRVRVMVANLTATPRRIQLNGLSPDASQARLRLLDETNARFAMQDPEQYRAAPPIPIDIPNGSALLELAPFAVARLDIG